MENKKIKILAIDDNRDNLISLKAIISEVLPQSLFYMELSGQGGIETARKIDPDVILLDIVMPEMDGYQVCKILKAEQHLSETPVIFLTALKGDKQSRILALEAGAEAFIAKPIDAIELKAQIQAMLKIKEAAALKKDEKLRLEALVQKRTEELTNANIASLNLLEDLKNENEIRRQREAELKISKELLSQTENIGKVGGWSFNIDTMEQKWTDEVYRIHEVEISQEPSVDTGINYCIGESKSIIEKAVQRAIEHGEDYDVELEIMTAKGNIRTVHSIGKADLKNRRIYGFYQDITDRKQAEEKNNKLLDQLELISLHLPGVIYQFKLCPDGSSYFPYASPGIYNIYGVQPKDVEYDATAVFKAIHPDDLAQVRDSINHSAQTLTTWHDIYRTNQPSGKTIWVEGKATPQKLEDGSIIWHGFIQDISERKIAAEALRESETNLKRILVNLQDAYFQADLSGNFTFVNPSAVAMYGYDSIGEMLGLPASSLYADKKVREHLIESISISGKIKDYEGRGLKKDGSSFWVSMSVQFVRDHNDQIIGTEGVVRDISDRKQKEEQILKFSQAVEQSPASIILTDTKGNVEYANPKALKITGYTLEELKGKNPRIFGSGEKPKSDYENLWATILSGKEWRGEFHNKKKNGDLFWELASISPIINKKGEIINFLAVKEDLTRNKQIEKDLIAAKEHAEESDRLKSAFLANMSHEIRTPMNGILGFAGLLKEPGISGEKQQKYIEIIEKSGDRMLNIINDIVDISKIESGTMKIYITVTDINEKIENLYQFFKPEAEAKNIQFSVEKTLPKNEAIIKTDSEKVYAVLTNLLKNAIKFTNKGEISFGVGYESAAAEKKQLKFFVKDTGMGIAKDRQKAIFERFIQADIYDRMALQGSGLGLSISKAYVEMLGGKIWVESELGIGSVFYFTIPCIGKTEEIIEKKSDVSIETDDKAGKLKILIAEDDEASSMYLSILVEEFSSEILTAKNGFEAVEIYKHHPDIDLILMDIQMPHLNGYEATSQIRKLNKNVVIIAQTAFALTYDRQKVIDAGCNDHIPKPILTDDLKTLIRKYFA